VYVACSTLSFARLPLEQALRLIGELEFSKLDVAIHEKGPHLKPSEVVEDVAFASQRIRIGPRLTPAAFSVEIEAADPQEYFKQLRAICKLARTSTVSTITIPAPPNGTDTEKGIQWLTEVVGLVQQQGLVLTVPTHIGTWTEFPNGALSLCQRVPGLGLTLDPSHYINGPHEGGAFDELFPYVRHVQLRDTAKGPGKFQVRVGQGEVEYGRLISMLARHRYDRLLSVAIHDVADAPFAMETEVRKLKFLLESLV
jgi:sugar phosphate isomerase/epimerase